MILSFSVSNYLSFKEKQTISFEAASIRDSVLTNTYQTAFHDLKVLKAIILFGPNGSGKSNFIEALRFVIDFISNSAKESQINEAIDVSYFKFNEATIKKPSSFEIKFLIGDLRYKYVLSVDSEKIHYEQLIQIAKTREYILFTRTFNSIVIEDRFGEAHNIEQFVRPNALFISVAALFNIKIAISILELLNIQKKIIFINDTFAFESVTAKMMENPEYKFEILNFLKTAGLSFKDLRFQKKEIDPTLLETLPKAARKSYLRRIENYLIQTVYDVFDEAGNVISSETLDLRHEESQGTRKMFAIAGPFIDAILHGKILVMDEFTARLHPKLASFIIKYFYLRTPNSLLPSQLILASHNTHIMDKSLFRRDQIYLTRRDKYYASEAQNLLQTGIRHDANYVKKYLEDELGFLPELIKLSSEKGPQQFNLFNEEDEK
ncbi:MAG TPA: ATP-binding protein [Bacteroidia bacterium]|nr:ATP-binding protein [Bacteroidia bacterium]